MLLLEDEPAFAFRDADDDDDDDDELDDEDEERFVNTCAPLLPPPPPAPPLLPAVPSRVNCWPVVDPDESSGVVEFSFIGVVAFSIIEAADCLPSICI
jgi:hypothetical protein